MRSVASAVSAGVRYRRAYAACRRTRGKRAGSGSSRTIQSGYATWGYYYTITAIANPVGRGAGRRHVVLQAVLIQIIDNSTLLHFVGRVQRRYHCVALCGGKAGY